MQEVRGSIPGRGTTDFCTLILFVYITRTYYFRVAFAKVYMYMYMINVRSYRSSFKQLSILIKAAILY